MDKPNLMSLKGLTLGGREKAGLLLLAVVVVGAWGFGKIARPQFEAVAEAREGALDAREA